MAGTERAGPPGPARLAVLALVLNAFTWGVSWWPFRELQALGLHALWATALIYAMAVLVLSAARPGAWPELLRNPSLWVLVLAAGTTNAAFNWAVTIGDVVRVVLLFYLMPLWAVLLARLMLHEAISGAALLRVGLALAGAFTVLWPEHGEGWPMPGNLAEALAVLGGFSFALNNVMLRREAHRSSAARALAMFGGGALVAGAVALWASLHGALPWPPPAAAGWLLGAAALGLAFIVSNLALQYGASRLPAQVTAVVMVSEVLFASGSALWLDAGTLTTRLALGGAMIVGASLLAARQR